MSNWKKLNQLCTRITDGSHFSPSGTSSGYPMLSVKDMRGNGFSYDDCKFIGEEDYLSLVKSDCKPLLNDILIAKDGSYLKHVFVTEEEREEVILSSIGILRPNQKLVNPYYIKYFLHSDFVKREVSKKYVSGSALPRIILKNFGEIQVPYIEKNKQDRIVNVLTSLDSKIELNKRINRELEQMAKLLYDYWFVQFEFPFDFAQGKPDPKGKPYKSSGGKMVWNEELKREIPEGWKVKPLLDFCSKIGDGIHGTPEYVDISDYNFINGNNLKNGFIEIDVDTKNVSSEEYERYFIELNQGTILLSINGTLGNLAVYTGEKVMLGKSAAYINCKGKNRPYCYQFLKLDHIQKQFWNIATGSTIKNLSLDSLKNLLIPFPGDDLIDRYFDLAQPIDAKRTNIFKENQQLASLRDWLLPMLMNGQVTVGALKV